MTATQANVSSYSHDERLILAIAKIGLVLTVDQRKSLLQYLALLSRWNRTYNLTAIRDPEQMLIQHVFDSLAALPVLNRLMGQSPHTKELWDLGSGAGLPGLVMAIVWPQHQINTVDSVAKKIAFQQHVIGELALRNARALHCRVENLEPTTPPDLIVCRAFTSLAQFAQACDRIAAPTTRLAALKGKLPQDEIDTLPAAWAIEQVIELAVPELDAERHLIIMSKS